MGGRCSFSSFPRRCPSGAMSQKIGHPIASWPPPLAERGDLFRSGRKSALWFPSSLIPYPRHVRKKMICISLAAPGRRSRDHFFSFFAGPSFLCAARCLYKHVDGDFLPPFFFRIVTPYTYGDGWMFRLLFSDK